MNLASTKTSRSIVSLIGSGHLELFGLQLVPFYLPTDGLGKSLNKLQLSGILVSVQMIDHMLLKLLCNTELGNSYKI